MATILIGSILNNLLIKLCVRVVLNFKISEFIINRNNYIFKQYFDFDMFKFTFSHLYFLVSFIFTYFYSLHSSSSSLYFLSTSSSTFITASLPFLKIARSANDMRGYNYLVLKRPQRLDRIPQVNHLTWTRLLLQ